MKPNPVDGAAAGSNARDALQVPSTLILACGGLGVLLALASAGLTAMIHAGTLGPLADDPTVARLAQQQTGAADYLGSVLWLAGSGALILGALKMRNLQSYGMAMAAAMLVMIPCGGCCCFGLPVGIWAVITLRKPEIKNQFPS